MKIINFRPYALYLIAAGLSILLGSLFIFLFKTTELDVARQINPTIFANFGALVGGVVGTLFSLAGVLLLIQNLNEQGNNFLRQQVEGRFYNLLRIHRENGYEITIGKRTGKKVFITLLREFYVCLDAVKQLSSKFQLDDAQTINVAYTAFYYGALGRSSERILRKRLVPKHGDKLVDEVISSLKNVSFNISQVRSVKEVGNENETNYSSEDGFFPYKLFEGHQSRLGHYFRHLFQAVKYVDLQTPFLLTYRDKYEYIKVLRAQFSTHEQVLLFLNSLSDLGQAWERDARITDPNSRLITKYNLIKNIPDGFVRDISVRQYFPDVSYEGDNVVSERRKQLESTYF